jgi:molybdopterin-guanine dinucleotide biosynthesis protein A
MTNQPVSCIILSGGKGKRFNRKDKGLVMFNNKSFIEHIIERINPQVDDVVISANRHVDKYKSFAKKVVEDITNDFQGPLAGVAACIPECKHEWILVIPCDIPLLPDDLVGKLIAKNNNKLIVAKANEQRQLVFLMHASLKENLDEFLHQGHHKAMSWIELQNPTVVMFEGEAGAFLNINTPEELEQLSD